MTDYSVYYSGGSGGFMFFYSLHLALGNNVSDRIKQNWDISNPMEWKNSETVGNRYSSLPLYNVNLCCNHDEPMDDGSTIITLYTDIETQIELGLYKNAGPLNVKDREGFLRDRIDNYQIVRSDHWPDVKTFKDFGKLPDAINEELVTKFDYPKDMSTLSGWVKHFHKPLEYNGVKVYAPVLEMINFSDYAFLLQDIVRTKFKCVTDALALPYNKEIAEHVDKWVALHPQNLRDLLYKDI